MKILFFLRDAFDCGGIQQTTSTICNMFSNEHKICTLSLYRKDKEPFFFFESNIEHDYLFDNKVNPKLNYLSIKKRVSNYLKNHNFDLIIVQAIEYSVFISREIWQSNKVIVCEHGHYGMGHFGGIHYFGVRTSLKNAKAIVTLTNLDKDDYKKHNYRNILLSSIPNAYILDNNSVAYNENSKIIVSCGSLVKIKQFDKSIKSISHVIKKHPEITYEIYGDGKQKNKLQKLIDKLGMSDNILLKGYERDKNIIFSGKSMLVVSSKFEGFGMVFLEAMQHQLPLVSFNVKYGPKEIIKNDFNGILVEKNNTKKLTEIVLALVENGNLRSSMSKSTKEVLKNYSPEVIKRKWSELFDQVGNLK